MLVLIFVLFQHLSSTTNILINCCCIFQFSINLVLSFPVAPENKVDTFGYLSTPHNFGFIHGIFIEVVSRHNYRGSLRKQLLTNSLLILSVFLLQTYKSATPYTGMPGYKRQSLSRTKIA